MPRPRTIAVLADYISFITEGYEGRLRQTFHSLCQERGLNLQLVYGRAIEEDSSQSHNAIFDLVDREHVHGVVLISSLLSSVSGPVALERFARRFAHFPICSLGVPVPGMPSIEVDNRPGMLALMEHLVVHHRLRKIAFIQGSVEHPEAKLRFDVYREVLAAHGIEYDPRLVVQGQFMRHLGHAAMQELLGRDLPIEAVVCANDAMAAGATDALHAAGRRIPSEIVVTGFDNLSFARLISPPLTTVSQPIERMAEEALDRVLAQLDGREVPLSTVLPAELVIRNSCGCRRESVVPLSAVPASLSASRYLREHHDQIRTRVAGFFDSNRTNQARNFEHVLSGLEAELAGQSDAAMRALDDALEAIGTDAEGHRCLHEAMSWLREELQGFDSAPAEWLWHELYERMLAAVTNALFQQRVDLDYNYMQLVGTGEKVSVLFELDSVAEMLRTYLPRTGVTTALLSRFIDDEKQEFEPFVRLVDGELLSSPVTRFPARALLPPGAVPEERRYSWVVFPMVVNTQFLGVAVIEYASGIIGYRLLCDQASAALQNVLLHREVVHKTMLHERSVQERLAANQRMHALRVLAGGVAHDLNNALGPLLALPDVMLRQFAEVEAPAEILRELRADMEGIKAATIRAAQTIKDLLTLSRQGRTPKTPLDVNNMILSCLGGDPRLVQGVSLGIKIALELHHDELRVIGSESHLVRAVSNLVHNAMDASPPRGKVVVRTTREVLSQPRRGYEIVPEGDYAVVSVSDGGSGIPSAAMSRIFEPFFSTKQVQEHSGTGLGLAIVHGVVKEHEGYVDVISSPGQGTTFSLYFPRTEDVAPIAAPPPSLRHTRAKVLIVDDDPTQRRTGQRVLRHYGYEVDTLASGHLVYAALEKGEAGSSGYDLLILDMHLGGEEDGLDILERVRQRFPDQKAIIISGHAADDRIEVAARKAVPWLVKPYTAESLATAVQGVLAGNPSIPLTRVSTKPP